MIYVVMVGCNNPVNARLLTHANGTTKNYSSKDEADEVAKKINDREGGIVARVVAV